MLKRKTAATVCISYTMEPDLPPCLQECCQEVRQAEEKESRRLVLPREDANAVDKYSRRGRRTADGDNTRTATRRLVLRRELLKDAIYMATKAVDKYSRRERQTAHGGWRTADENSDNTRTATRRLVLHRELLKDAKRAGHR